jgi:peptidoglycan-N-acetylglucosamine deacetylase
MLAQIAATGLATAGFAAGGYAYAAMWPTSQIFGPTLLAGSDASEFALTFDDGPNDRYTIQLLDILAQYQIRATFFMIGRFVRQRPELARAVRDAGHLVGNHTMSHPVLLFQSPSRVREELATCNAELEDALGERVQYFRPPHGARRPDVLRAARELGLTTVLWNAMGYDWETRATAISIETRLRKGIRRNQNHRMGSNLLLHDGGQAGIGQNRSRTVSAVASLVPRALDNGIRFVTVDAWNTEG